MEAVFLDKSEEDGARLASTLDPVAPRGTPFTLMIAYDFDGHSRSLLYRIVTVIAALLHAPTDLAPASKGDSFSCVHGPGIDDHRSRGRLGGDCHRQPAGRDERERASQLFCMTTTSGPVYYHHDGLGSTVALTDAAGAKIESYTYDVFGTVSIFDAAGFPQSSSTAGNRFLFTGREFVKEANLYDYRNRIYSSELGRFLQTDPIRFDAGDVNLYRYVSNNPVNWVDPTGLGKIGFCIKTVKGIWKKVGKDRARKELAEKGDVLVQGAGSSKDAKNMAREVFGDRTTRHDPHQAGQKPHYQHKNGGRGHVFYKTLAAATAINWLGDNALGNTIDFFNPLSDVKDVIDLANELLASGDEEESCECP
jgi:RHS repeat-associated protein